MLAAALVIYSMQNNLIPNLLSAYLVIFLLLYINQEFDKTDYDLVYYCVALLSNTKEYNLEMNKFIMEIGQKFSFTEEENF